MTTHTYHPHENGGDNIKVVNIKSKKYDVYIGRAGHGKDGYFGNPYSEKKYGRTKCLWLYERYFYSRLRTDAEFRERIHSLRGKTLGCFCKPKACHGDIIVNYLRSL